MKKFVTYLTILLTIFAFVSCNSDTKPPSDSSPIEKYQDETDKALQAELEGTSWYSSDNEQDIRYYKFEPKGLVTYRDYNHNQSGNDIAEVKGKYVIIDNDVFYTYPLPDNKKPEKIPYSINKGQLIIGEFELTSDNNNGLIGTWIETNADYTTTLIFDKSLKGQRIDINKKTKRSKFLSILYFFL